MQFFKGFPIIDDDTPDDDLFKLVGPDGIEYARGLIPRDYAQYPEEMFAPPSDMKVIPKSDWDARIQEQEERESSLEHMYLSGAGGLPKFTNLDQNGHGYCWAYSTAHTVMLARLRDNQPIYRLNPHSVAAIIKKGRDEGGWCGLSAQFFRDHGCAIEGKGPGQWPLHSRSTTLDTPVMREAMAHFRITEDWVDLKRAVHAQNLTELQIATALLSNQPCALDFAWWGHSVCGIRKIKIEAGSYGTLILNSWKGWGRHGLGIIRGSKENTMGAICTRVVRVFDAEPLIVV